MHLRVVLCLNIVLDIRLMLVEMNISKDTRVYILFQKCEEYIKRDAHGRIMP